MLFSTKEELKSKIFRETEKLSKASVLPKSLTREDITELHDLVHKTIYDFCKIGTLEHGCRIWLGKECIEEEKKIGQLLFENPIDKNTSIQDWLNTILKTEEYCVIINRCEAFNDLYASKISTLTTHLLEGLGIPSDGIITTLIIGNYGYTPFGIHKDSEGACSFNLHLGPGDKILYNWEDSDFECYSDSEKKNIDHCISSAKAFNFGPEDILFIPANTYHVGYSNDFSISLTFWFNNHNIKRIFKRLFSYIESNFVASLNDKTTDFTSINKFSNHLEEMIEPISNPKGADRKLIDLLTEQNEERLYYLQSNAGMSSKPIVEELNNNIADNFESISKNCTFCLKKPFKLIATERNQNISIYLRGRKIVIKSHLSIYSLIIRLNSYEHFSYIKLNELLPKEWPKNSKKELLLLLYHYKALEIL